MDIYNPELPTIEVNAENYNIEGIRDEEGNLICNQILVLEDVFSGGTANAYGKIEQLSEKEIPIPDGEYDLLEFEKNSEQFKVDPVDEIRYDDHHQGEYNSIGEERSGYRFHIGTVSHGCITVNSARRNRDSEWKLIKQLISTTTVSKVPKRERLQKYIPFTNRLKYGTIYVR